MYYFVIFGYLALMFVVGFSIKLKEKSLEEINVANRSLGTVQSGFSIAATWIWAPALFVSSQKAFENGILGFWWFFVPNVLSLLLFAFLSVNSLKKMKREHTLSELMGNIYSSKRVKRIYDFELLFLIVCSTGVQLLAGGKVISLMTNMNFGLVTALLAVVALLYSLAKGIKASVKTDFIQMILIVVAVVAAMVFVLPKGNIEFGGIKRVTTNIFSEENWKFFLAFGLTTSIGLLAGPIGDQTFWQRAFSMRRKKVVKAFGLGALMFAIVPVGMAIIGFAAAGANFTPVDVSMVGLEYVMKSTPEIIGIMFLLCVISGLSSTLDSNMCATGSIVSKFSKKTESVKYARIGMIVIAVGGVLIANIPNINIFWLFLFYGVLRTSVAMPTIFTMLTRKKIKESAIFYGILAAFIVGVPVYSIGAVGGISILKTIGTLLVLLLPLIFIIFGGYDVKVEKAR